MEIVGLSLGAFPVVHWQNLAGCGLTAFGLASRKLARNGEEGGGRRREQAGGEEARRAEEAAPGLARAVI